jgi:hypothetical protein
MERGIDMKVVYLAIGLLVGYFIVLGIEGYKETQSTQEEGISITMTRQNELSARVEEINTNQNRRYEDLLERLEKLEINKSPN